MSEAAKFERHNISISETPLGPEALLERLQEVGELYRAARTVFPWHETDLSLDEACEYIGSLAQAKDFGAFMAESPEGQLVAARLHELITLDRLEEERGSPLRGFVQALIASNEVPLIWTRETFVDPNYQGQGVATRLGHTALAYIADHYKNGVVLCRVRSDNIGSLTGIRRVGYRQSGVQQSHPRISGLKHEYWYRQL